MLKPKMGRAYYCILYLYVAFLWVIQPWIWLRWYRLGALEPAYRERWSERRGFLPADIPAGVIWIHAVSLGEGVAALALLKALRRRWPDRAVLLSTGTPSGSAQIQAQLSAGLYHCYLPVDRPLYVRRFLDKLRPQILILLESELWPVLLHEIIIREIPVCLMNARLSLRSQKRYRSFKVIAAVWMPVIAHAFLFIAAQSEKDRQVFLSMGFDDHRVVVLGNLKSDQALMGLNAQQEQVLADYAALKKERWIWVAASTQPGEEEIILAAHALLCQEDPQALLILVPRHPYRAPAIEKLLIKMGFSYAQRSRSDFSSKPDEVFPLQTTVYLADTLGELGIWYSLSHVAFVGGSLVPGHGGHSIAEPAALGRPILLGPYASHVMTMAQALAEVGALTWVRGEEDVAEALQRYRHNPQQEALSAQAAAHWMTAQRGVAERGVDLLAPWL